MFFSIFFLKKVCKNYKSVKKLKLRKLKSKRKKGRMNDLFDEEKKKQIVTTYREKK